MFCLAQLLSEIEESITTSLGRSFYCKYFAETVLIFVLYRHTVINSNFQTIKADKDENKTIINSSFLCGSTLYSCRWVGGVLEKSLPLHNIVSMTWVTPSTMTGCNTKVLLFVLHSAHLLSLTHRTASSLSGLLILQVIKLYTEILSSDSMICEGAWTFQFIQAWIQDSCNCCCLSLSLSVIFCSYFTIKKNSLLELQFTLKKGCFTFS